MDYSVSEDVLKCHGNVFSLLLGGKRVWVKKRRGRDNPGFLRLQRLFYSLTRLTLAVPPGEPPRDNVAFETERLRQAAGLGIHVPAVLQSEEDYFVLEEAGEALHWRMRRRPQEAAALADRAASELRRLHDSGIVHGGAQVKNITLKNEEIHFIDFEENIPGDRPEEFRLRDLFLFLFSLQKIGVDPDLRRICGSYGRGDAEEVLKRLIAAVMQLRMLRAFTSRLFSPLRLHDIRAICALVDKAEREQKRMQGL